MIRTLEIPMTRVERASLAASLLLAAALMWPVRDHGVDSAFIHLHYARHLAEGQGLVFNPGERVYGNTHPLWVALIADGVALGLDGLVVARALGVLGTLVSVALFLQLTRRTMRTPALRALATLAWASHAWMVEWSVSGMETPLAVALTLGGFVAFTEGKQWGSRPVRTGALWGLAALTRPEAVFLLVLWGVVLIVDAQNRAGVRRLFFGVLPPAVIYGSWLLFARVYFGTFWPQNLSGGFAGAEGLSGQASHLGRQIRIVSATDGLLLALLVVALLVLARRRQLRPRISQELLPWLWVSALPALYVARGVQVSSRHLLILLPVVAWLAWRAAETWWLGPGEAPGRSRRAVVAGAAVAALVLIQNLEVYRSGVLPQVRSRTIDLEESLVKWGRWFDLHAPPHASIATPDIGAIGYFSRRRVVDVSGLVSPRMTPFLERETWETALARFRFASFDRPLFVVDRAARQDDLRSRSPYRERLTPIGRAKAPRVDPMAPGTEWYTVYRVDWNGFDRVSGSP